MRNLPRNKHSIISQEILNKEKQISYKKLRDMQPAIIALLTSYLNYTLPFQIGI